MYYEIWLKICSIRGSIQMECAHYLVGHDTELHIISKYSNVKELFVRYNMMISSPTAVEKLFSFGGIIQSAKQIEL